MNDFEKKARALFAEAVLTSLEQDITIFEVNSYIEDGDYVCAVACDKSRALDILINFGDVGICDAEESEIPENWYCYGEDDASYVYGTIRSEESTDEN